MSANFTSIVNDDFVSPSSLSSAFPLKSNQASYADLLSGATVSAAVPADAVFVFCNGNAPQSLVLPSASPAGKDLIILTRSANAVNSVSSGGSLVNNVLQGTYVATSGSVASASSVILLGVAGSWVHLVSNGSAWVVVARNKNNNVL